MAEQVNNSGSSAMEQRAYHPLARLRRVIRGYVLVEGIVLALILGCLWFWFSIALDYSLHHFSNVDMLDAAPPVRWIMMAIFGLAITGIVVWYIFRRLFRDFSNASLAMVLENRFPALLGDRLITAIELADLKRAEKQGYSVDMIVKTMKDAKERVDQVPVLSVFNWWRLVMLVWTLVGVSLFVLLLTYPVAVLFSLIDMVPSREVWMMLTINGIVALGLIFVFMVPCLLVSMRKRQSSLRWVVLGVGVLCLGATAVGYHYSINKLNSVKLDEYTWRAYHVADIGVDRNLKFGDTRWPRDEFFVDWLDFPVDEKRVQNNRTINARALFTTWIVADNTVPGRWRPLRWSDLPRIVDAKEVPELPLEAINEYIIAISSGDERSPVGFDKTRLKLPTRDDATVDLVFAAVESADHLSLTQEQVDAFATLKQSLAAIAESPKRGGRLVRHVNAPGEATLVYGNNDSKFRGRSALKPMSARPNVFQLEQPVKLDDTFAVMPSAKPADGEPKEKFVPLVAEATVAGRTLKTDPRSVVLVSPPKLQSLTYQEFRPAYFYYLPPAGPRVNTIDERRVALREMKQARPPLTFASPAEAFSLPDFSQGSDVAFTSTADKKLVEVNLTPRSVEFPGVATKDDIKPLPLAISEDGRSFTIRFGSKGKSLAELLATKPDADGPTLPGVKSLFTFDVTMKDIDNMVSTRSYTLRPIDDKLPSVNLFVDVIRQIKENNRTFYVCTAQADIPFAKESNIVDEHGLHKLEFTYEFSPIVNPAYLPELAQQTAWSMINPPAIPGIGDIVLRKEVLTRTLPIIREIINRDMPEAIRKAPNFGSMPITAFDNAQGLANGATQMSIEDVKKKLGNPLGNDHVSPVLKQFSFKDFDTPLTFDLLKSLPQLREKNSAGIIPGYRLVLDVQATDSNVAADQARVARNAETLEFKIVGEQELYTYISKEEAELVRRFDELINELEKHQKDLEGVISRVRTISDSTAVFEQNRIEKILDAISNSRTATNEVYTSYLRIQREYKVNRFPDKLTNDLSVKIVDPLRVVQAKEYPNAANEMSKFYEILRQGRPDIAIPQGAVSQQSFIQLLDALRQIRKEMGDSIGFNKLALQIKAILDGQVALTRDDLQKVEQAITDDLLRIQFLPKPADVEVEAGKSVKVSLNLKMPKTITEDPVLRFELPANSGLKVAPSPVILKDDATKAEFDVTAGPTKGTFFLRIVPSQGNPIDLKVEVK